ncbi:hypothetical protein FHP25_23330 [Vineibacter terrae]|uniref:Uncharacterized protein n=1 Tax=Vineibacter terrae TaxID=2586908 RepID=A0A5C8PGW8_9HYPH|nr:hypothetical protein [Vineibacter terrae]TXL72919.1 hypothetical protein FHP25_23330 [Vineibacter terrae]
MRQHTLRDGVLCRIGRHLEAGAARMRLVRPIAACTSLLGILALTGCGECPGAPASAASDNGQPPSSELARCEALYAQYWRYMPVNNRFVRISYAGILEAEAAVENCRHGNTKDGIATLRQKVGSGGCG